jgi:hypothetical protein
MTHLPALSDQTSSSEVLSDENLISICEAIDALACQCPGYLVRLLREVKKFHRYTQGCIEKFPEETETHYWLMDRANTVEQLLSETIMELLQKEDLLDEHGQICFKALSDRAQQNE